MKKYILILGLLVTSLAFSQGGYTRPPVTTTAINVTIADAGAIITATEVENALQENRALINLITIPYKIYVALISQTATNAPTVIVLENTLSGAIVWTYDNVGTYIGTLVAAFTVDKVFALTGGGFGLVGQNVTLVKSTNDTILLNSSSNSGTKTDGLLTKAYIEIRVYN